MHSEGMITMKIIDGGNRHHVVRCFFLYLQIMNIFCSLEIGVYPTGHEKKEANNTSTCEIMSSCHDGKTGLGRFI